MKKTIFAAIALLTAMAGSAAAQCYSVYVADVWMWNYSGDQVRGGILPYGYANQVGGVAFASNGQPQLNTPPGSLAWFSSLRLGGVAPRCRRRAPT